MIPIGVGITFAAYTVGIWGYCLVRGYNVKFTQLFASAWPGTQKASTANTAGASGTGPAPTRAAGPTPLAG